jgi:multidrug efflux pump subunit AcrA (membrane-fusion protein)
MKLTRLYVLYFSVFMVISCKQKDTWIHPEFSPITEALFASGHIEPMGQFLLTSSSEGYLQQSYVKESDLVQTGEVLFALDYHRQKFEEEGARDNLYIARQNASPESPALLKLKSDLQVAQQKAVRDSVQYLRLKRLYESQSVSLVDVENARLQYEQDLNNVKAIHESTKSTKLSLQQSLIQAQTQYNTSRASNQYYQLRSPRRARVYQLMKKEGELVRKGETVALLGNTDSLIVMLLVDESGISKIKESQTVLIELNTDKGKTYTAKVSRIYPYFDSASQSFRVEALFDEVVDHMIAGTLLQANIIVAKKDNALLIPRACLSPGGKVTVKRNGRSETVAPQTGIVSTDWVEILSGLTTDDEVLKTF